MSTDATQKENIIKTPKNFLQYGNVLLEHCVFCNEKIDQMSQKTCRNVTAGSRVYHPSMNLFKIISQITKMMFYGTLVRPEVTDGSEVYESRYFHFEGFDQKITDL